MLLEAFQYLITPAGREARRLGHLAASISLWSRAGRCRAAWAEHERRCHAAVEQAIEGLPRRRTVLVLGSGLMRDVDLDGLAASFQQVMLVDLVHLWPLRWRVAGRRNVELAVSDLAGADGLLAGTATQLIDPLVGWRADPEIDLVISANMLSQLPLLPIEYVARHRLIRSKHLAAEIVRNHLDGLRGFGCRVCLLTDTERITRDRRGEIGERSDLLQGVALPSPPLAWEWTLAPFGEIDGDFERIHRVAAYPDFLRTERGGA